jgi:hypothetical protein
MKSRVGQDELDRTGGTGSTYQDRRKAQEITGRTGRPGRMGHAPPHPPHLKKELTETFTSIMRVNGVCRRKGYSNYARNAGRER